MARGKYAERSAKRQAELAVTSDLASYQHRVAKLTAENRELRERLATQERTAKQTERRLRAERDEGVAPQVAAIEMQLRSALAARDESRERMRYIQKCWDGTFGRLITHYQDDHGMTKTEAFETVGRLTNPEAFGDDIFLSDPQIDKIPRNASISRAQRISLQQARGVRS